MMMKPLKNKNKMIKFTVSATTAMSLVAIHYYFHLLAGEFLCAIVYGLMLSNIWGKSKPLHELEYLWGFATPFLFGTIGASLDFKKITPDLVG